MNYTRIAARAARLLAKDGQPMTLLKVTPGTYNPTTGVTTGATSVSYTFHGVVVPIAEMYVDGKVREFNDEFKGPTDISFTDEKVFLSATCTDVSGNVLTNIAPLLEDKISYGGKTYAVKKVSPLCPAGINVLFDLDIRL